MSRPECIVADCIAPSVGLGRCHKHWRQHRRYGFVIDFTVEPADIIWQRFHKSPSGCWIWHGRTTKAGYGEVSPRRGTRTLAHRAIYELLVGPIPDGLHIDHLCRVHACVNPSHLEPVTPRENAVRGINGRLTTHCPQGHPYDESNTYWHLGSHGYKVRRCRECVLARGRALVAARADRCPDCGGPLVPFGGEHSDRQNCPLCAHTYSDDEVTR